MLFIVAVTYISKNLEEGAWPPCPLKAAPGLPTLNKQLLALCLMHQLLHQSLQPIPPSKDTQFPLIGNP